MALQIRTEMGRRVFRAVEEVENLGVRFTTMQLCGRIGNLTPRKLQWWYERNIVRPRIEAHCKLYSLEEALLAIVIDNLCGQHLSLQTIRKFLPKLRRILQNETHPKFLLVHGSHPMIVDAVYDHEKLIDGVLGCKRALIVVNVLALKESLLLYAARPN